MDRGDDVDDNDEVDVDVDGLNDDRMLMGGDVGVRAPCGVDGKELEAGVLLVGMSEDEPVSSGGDVLERTIVEGAASLLLPLVGVVSAEPLRMGFHRLARNEEDSDDDELRASRSRFCWRIQLSSACTTSVWPQCSAIELAVSPRCEICLTITQIVQQPRTRTTTHTPHTHTTECNTRHAPQNTLDGLPWSPALRWRLG